MEETVYQLYLDSIPPVVPDKDAQQKQILKDSKISLLKTANLEAQTKAVVAAELLHLNSKRNLESTFSVQRRQHGTFGLPKSAYQNQNETKKPFGTMHVTGVLPNARYYDVKPADKTHQKPPIPKLTEGPLQGLSSNVDFQTVNRQRATSMKAPKPSEKTDFLSKPNYGQCPGYLDRVKSTIASEKEYLQMIAKARNPPPEAKEALTAEEKDALLAALKRKHAEVNKIYQGVTHISKVYSGVIKRKKEGCEKELLQIEKDIKLLEKGLILVDNTR